MSIPIRIHNEHTKDIRVVMVDRGDRRVHSYRIAPGQLSPTFDMEQVGLHGGHALVVGDEEHFVATDPTKDTDIAELADVDDEQEVTQA